MDDTIKIIVPIVLMGGGAGLVAWGLRPKTDKEKSAKRIFEWSPAKMDVPPESEAALRAIREEMNSLRSRIRALWAAGGAFNLPIVLDDRSYKEAYGHDDCPWWRQDVPAVGTFKVNNSAGKYTTDIISPALQSAFSIVDLALYLSGIVDIPAQCPVQGALAALRSLTDEQVAKMSVTAAMSGGTYLQAMCAQNYARADARERKAALDKAYGGNGLFTWIALNSPFSPVSEVEQLTQKRLRSLPYRQPRLLVP